VKPIHGFPLCCAPLHIFAHYWKAKFTVTLTEN